MTARTCSGVNVAAKACALNASPLSQDSPSNKLVPHIHAVFLNKLLKAGEGHARMVPVGAG